MILCFVKFVNVFLNAKHLVFFVICMYFNICILSEAAASYPYGNVFGFPCEIYLNINLFS